MNLEPAKIRYCAISMELAAYLDDHYVEMHILTDTGKAVAIVCREDSILAIQRNIEKLAGACPEIATWRAAAEVDAHGGNVGISCEPAPPGRGPGGSPGKGPSAPVRRVDDNFPQSSFPQ